eukprot:654444-Pleurochrysis_carterae.AAC.1
MSATEKMRAVDVDGEIHVCSDDDFEKELAYLKEKARRARDTQPWPHAHAHTQTHAAAAAAVRTQAFLRSARAS